MDEVTGRNISWTYRSIQGLKRAREIAPLIQEDFPNIGDLYGPLTYREIVHHLNIMGGYNLSEKLSITAVAMAITGFEGIIIRNGNGGSNGNGHLELKPLEALLTEEELEKIAYEHFVENGRRGYEAKKGIHGRTKQKMQEDGRKGGLKTKREGKGIFGMTPEQWSEAGRKGGLSLTYEQHVKAGRASAKARGDFCPGDAELGDLRKLAQDPEFIYQKGRLKGCIKSGLIAGILNDNYHDGKEKWTPKRVSLKWSKIKPKD